MAAHAGERAEATGNFHCERCGDILRVDKGDRIPRCPRCGNDTFAKRTAEKH